MINQKTGTPFYSLLLIICIVAIASCTSQKQNNKEAINIQVVNGTIERIDSFPSKYVPPRNVDIWLPDNYSTDKKCSVLYMHDGQMLFDSTTTWNHLEWGVDEVLSKMIAADPSIQLIVVGIWNTGSTRHSEYFPQQPFEAIPEEAQKKWLNMGKENGNTGLFVNGIQSDNYLKFLVEELKPYIDQHYATKPDFQHTLIAGSSMGGLISMYALCEYPQVFSRAACLSTHWVGIFEESNNPFPNSFALYLKHHLPDPATHKLYFDFGTETLDALYEPYQIMVDSVMIAKGYSNQNWQTLKFPGDDHSEKSWRNRLDKPLHFLLKNE